MKQIKNYAQALKAPIVFVMLLAGSLAYAASALAQENIRVIQNNTRTISGKQFLFYDTKGTPVSKSAFDDSLSIGDYNLSFRQQDTITHISLVEKLEKENVEINKLIGQKNPLQECRDITGNAIKFGTDTAVLMCFWSVHCAICIEELIAFNTLAREYPEVKFVAVTSDDSAKTAKFMEAYRYKWSNIAIVSDYDHGNFKPTVLPTNVVIDRHGVVRGIHKGRSLRKVLTLLNSINVT